MTTMEKLFSFDGRIGREDYLVINFFLFLVLSLVFLYASLELSVSWATFDRSARALAAYALIFSMTLLCGWINVALCVKRLHDLNYSGWIQAVILIPFVNLFWIPIWAKLMCQKGATTQNRYGVAPT